MPSPTAARPILSDRDLDRPWRLEQATDQIRGRLGESAVRRRRNLPPSGAKVTLDGTSTRERKEVG